MKQLSELLDLDEVVIWHSRPNYLVWALNRLLIPSLIILPSFGLTMYGLVIQGLAVLIVLLMFILFLLFWLLWDYFIIFSKKGFPNYYITSKSKILILSELDGLTGPFSPNETIFEKATITNITSTQNIFEKILGTNCKTINFNLAFIPERYLRVTHVLQNTSGQLGETIVQNLSNNPNKLSFKIKTNLSPQEESIAFSRSGSKISLSSVDNYEEILSQINDNQNEQIKHAYWKSKASFKGKLTYSLIKDAIRLLKSTFGMSLIFTFLLIMIYFFAGSIDMFVKIISYYLPSVLLIISLILLLNSYTLKVLLHILAPKYEIVGNMLRIYPRSFKIFVDTPFEEIDISKINKIWQTNLFGDKNSSYLLGIELDPVNNKKYPHNNKLVSKFLKIWTGVFFFRILISIPNPEQLINKINIQPEKLDSNIFGNIVFYYL